MYQGRVLLVSGEDFRAWGLECFRVQGFGCGALCFELKVPVLEGEVMLSELQAS